MKTRNLFGCAAFAAVLAASGAPAQAAMIAGWDFSQWFNAGALSVDGATAANTLAANYSSFDPTFGLGTESATFGTMYIDGQFGSTEVIPDFSGSEIILPSAGSLASNLNAPGAIPFDSLGQLQAEGQPFANLLAMQASAPVAAVFEIDLSSLGAGSFGDAWEIAFAANTLLAGTSSIAVSFSPDGSSYTGAGTANLTTLDSLFTFPLAAGIQDKLFVKLDLQNASLGSLPTFDNVSISGNVTIVPEPGTLLLLGSGLAGLVMTGRRRR